MKPCTIQRAWYNSGLKYLAPCLLALALSIPAVAQEEKPLSDYTNSLIRPKRLLA